VVNIATQTLDSLLVKVTADIKDYEKKMGTIQSKGSKAFDLVKKGALAFGAGLLVATTAITGLAMKAAKATDNVDKMSQRLGISRQGYQEWDYVLGQAGVSIDNLGSGMKSMVNRVDEMVQGIGDGADIFNTLGVSIYDSSGALKDQEVLFNESVTALQAMEEGTEKAALANDLFGRSGQALMPLLNGTAESVENLKNKANDLGMVMSDDAIDAGVVFTDTLDTLKRAVGAIFTKIGVDLMPMIQTFADWIIAHMPQIQAVFSTVFEVIGTVVGGFVTLVGNVIEWLGTWRDNNQSVLDAIMGIFTSVFGVVTDC